MHRSAEFYQPCFALQGEMQRLMAALMQVAAVNPAVLRLAWFPHVASFPFPRVWAFSVLRSHPPNLAQLSTQPFDCINDAQLQASSGSGPWRPVGCSHCRELSRPAAEPATEDPLKSPIHWPRSLNPELTRSCTHGSATLWAGLQRC